MILISGPLKIPPCKNSIRIFRPWLWEISMWMSGRTCCSRIEKGLRIFQTLSTCLWKQSNQTPNILPKKRSTIQSKFKAKSKGNKHKTTTMTCARCRKSPKSEESQRRKSSKNKLTWTQTTTSQRPKRRTAKMALSYQRQQNKARLTLMWMMTGP
jgi:hypothetical protein